MSGWLHLVMQPSGTLGATWREVSQSGTYALAPLFQIITFKKKNSISYFMWYENKDIDLYFKLEWFWHRCVLCVKLSFWTLAIVKIVKVAMFRNFILLPSSGWEMENQSVLSHDWAVLSIYLFESLFVCLFVILASLAIRTEAYECKFVFVSSSQKHSFFFHYVSHARFSVAHLFTSALL